jgi:hypothetical protein
MASKFNREVPYADHRIDRHVNPGNSNEIVDVESTGGDQQQR